METTSDILVIDQEILRMKSEIKTIRIKATLRFFLENPTLEK